MASGQRYDWTLGRNGKCYVATEYGWWCFSLLERSRCQDDDETCTFVT